MTKYLSADEHRRLTEPEYYEGRKSVDLDLVDAGYHGGAPEDRHRLARKIEEAALETGKDEIISVTAGASESRSLRAMVSTNGFEGYEEQTGFWCGAEATARDGGDKRPEDWWYEGYRHRSELSDPAEIGRKAALRALDRVGADKIPTGELPLIVENRTCGRILRYFGQAMNGNMLQQKRSFLEGMEGKQVWAEHVSVTDDPFIKRGQGSRLFDEEGISARKLPMIESGVLRNYYIDTYYGRKLGRKATTGSSSNVVLVSKKVKSVEAWVKELGRGILVTGFLGGNSNSATGDFSTGIQGFLFENGEIARPVAAMNLAGNHLEFWKKLRGLGDDPYPFSSFRSPSLVFEPMVIAGA